ncbi:thrombospondin type 3 repeat-containing protein [Pseudomonas aeruginosa]|uniref:thrombospondin type 3 repeat-containing protein n=1 Tax=Pseudomonas aeruginosa TaxID=287 RepID=UPI004046C1EB
MQEFEPGLLMSRELYMPADGRSYVRVLDKFYNITEKALVARPELLSKPAHAPYGHEQSTSSGDGQLTTEDRWVQQKSVGYDANDSVSLMHVFADETGRQALSGDFYVDPYYSWGVGYEFEVPANDHRVVMSFMAAEHSALPNGTLQVLDTLGEDVLRGIIAEDRSRIVNFTLCADTDLDQLCDSAEELAGTRKDLRDTDGDRFDDEIEVRLGSDPNDSMSMPEFDVYFVKGNEVTTLVKLNGFDGQPVQLREFEAPFRALDFDAHNRLRMAVTATENDSAAMYEFDPDTLEQGEDQVYLRDGELIDVLAGRDFMSLHLLDQTVQEEPELETPMSLDSGERSLALHVNTSRWGSWTALQMPARDGCGFGLAKWKGEPLILNDCQLIRFDYSISGEKQQPLVALDFSSDFAGQPRILSMDDMPWIDALLAIVEDGENGVRRRHLGFIDMRTGEVIRLGAMPVDASGITVKFKDFQNEPVWPEPAAPH